MKNNTTLMCVRNGDHLRDAKMSMSNVECRKNVEKRTPHSVEFNFLTICHKQKQFLRNERRRADLQDLASIFFFCQGTKL